MIGAMGDSHLAVQLIYPLCSPCCARLHKASLVLFAVKKGPSMSKACICFSRSTECTSMLDMKFFKINL